MACDESSALSRPLEGVFVLVVEDYEDARTLFATLLSMSGAHVTAVGSVAAAREALDRTHYDVIVSDLNLPDQDGFDLIRHLRGRPDPLDSGAPAIAVTAQEDQDVRQRALESGYQKFLDKPLDASDLIAAIEDLVKPRPNESIS